MNFTLWFVAGLVLAVPFLLIAYRLDEKYERAFLGVGLVIAAGVWVMFSAFHADPKWIAIEVAGMAIYTVFAIVGAGRSYLLIGVGWALHSIWDIVLHVTGPGYSMVTEPANALWYSIACCSFDLLVAVYVCFKLSEDRYAQQQPVIPVSVA